MAEHHVHCEALVREEDKDRFLATLFAPARYRPALFALYAFDLETGRVMHVVNEPMAGEIRLQWWHDVITGEAHTGGSPVATALIEAMRDFDLPPTSLLEVIEARREALQPDASLISGDIEDRAMRIGAPIFALAARILNDGAAPDAASLSQEAGTAFVMMRSGATDKENRAAAERRISRTGNALRRIPEKLWPAFLPLAPVRALLAREGRPLSAWRRQWIVWRAARNLPAALS